MRTGFSIALFVVAACSGGNSTSTGWQCHDVTIDHGTKSVCDGPAFGTSASGASYACVPDAPSVAPRAGTSDGTSGGTADGTSSGGSSGATASGGTADGTSSSSGASSGSSGGTTSACPPGTHPGTTGDGAGGGGGGGSSGASSGASGSGGGAGGPGSTGDGGGYQCTPTSGGVECTSTDCDKGYHATSCGTCVADGTSDNCGGGGHGDAGAGAGCTLTQGYWKTHPSAWPVTSLTLGSTTYTQAQLLAILGDAPGGDASLVLAHQLIAALLNGAAGAGQGPVASVVSQAQSWLSANGKTLPYGTSSSSPAGAQAISLANQLDSYNNGASGVPHCN